MIDPHRLEDDLLRADVLIASPGRALGDVEVWATIGAALVLDKPIVVLLAEGDTLPGRLGALGLSVVYYPPGTDPMAAPGLAWALTAASQTEATPVPDGPTTKRPRKPPGGA